MNIETYIALCRQQKTEWLTSCFNHPSEGMKEEHLAAILQVITERHNTTN